jgi:biofilm PGA synthesis N-glycosyltransferase PgaC
MEVLFWASFLFLAYVFIGYPMLLPAVRLVCRKKVHKRYITPSVTIVVAVRNEKDRIERRLQNLFEIDYPREKLQMIVSLDGPTDGTETVVQRHQGIEIVHSRWPRGKAAAINAAMERTSR